MDLFEYKDFYDSLQKICLRLVELPPPIFTQKVREELHHTKSIIDTHPPTEGNQSLNLLEIAKSLYQHATNEISSLVNIGQLQKLQACRDDLANLIQKLYKAENSFTASLNTQDIMALRKLFDQQSEEINKKTSEMLTSLNKLESSFEDKTDSVKAAANTATEQIETLLNNTKKYAASEASLAIYKDYRSSAISEKKVSDDYRLYSVLAMGGTAILAIISIIQASFISLSITQIVSRIALSIILGVMAAYFARESGKHRRQQYLYQQFSLNLNALPLFIADLEEAQKGALKSEIAKIIFTSSHENKVDNNSYPLDIQEILLALIDKLPPKGN